VARSDKKIKKKLCQSQREMNKWSEKYRLTFRRNSPVPLDFELLHELLPQAYLDISGIRSGDFF